MSRDQRKGIEEIKSACDPGNSDAFSLIKSLLDKAVWYQIYNGMKGMGKGYAEQLVGYKEDFGTFIEDMKKAGIETGRMYKDVGKQLLEAFIKRWKEIKDQIASIPTEVSTLMATILNPLTTNAGISAYFSFKKAFETLRRLYYETACILLDFEIYIMDESDVKEVAKVGDSFTKFIKGFIVSGKGFVAINKAVTILDTLVNSLISVGSKLSNVGLDNASLSILQKESDERTNASLFIMSKAAELADVRKDFQGYLFEVIDVEVTDITSEAEEAVVKKKKFQYIGCDPYSSSESDSTDKISCTSNYNLTTDGLAPISVSSIKELVRNTNVIKKSYEVFDTVPYITGSVKVSIFELNDVIKKKKMTESNLSSFITSPKLYEVDNSLESISKKTLSDFIKGNIKEVPILYKETDLTRWTNPNYWVEL